MILDWGSTVLRYGIVNQQVLTSIAVFLVYPLFWSHDDLIFKIAIYILSMRMDVRNLMVVHWYTFGL